MKILRADILYLLLLVTFLKELVFASIIPIWHTPDEQAHFAQVAFFVETGLMPKSGKDLNREIYESERLLGTLRDKYGNNKFTFRPDYKIEFSNNKIGIFENEINTFPTSYRVNYVGQEAANYPPLFYWLSAISYKFFYGNGLIDRVFAARFISILMGLGTVLIAWLIGKELFRDKALQVILPILVSFQPMFSFVSVGVTSDNLFNFIFTGVLFVGILLIKYGPRLNILLLMLLTCLLAYLTKPQFILSIPIFSLAFGMYFMITNKISQFKKVMYTGLAMMLIILVVALVLFTPFPVILEKLYPQSFLPGTKSSLVDINFIQFFRESLRHTYAEVVPWYWGVFDWLGVTYPRIVHRMINWVMVGAAVGLIIKFWRVRYKRAVEDYLFLFLLLSALIYFMGIVYYNYLFTLAHGFPFGIQGRYYFPTIVSHMAIILVGLYSLLPDKFSNLRYPLVKTLGVSMIILNAFALWTIAKTYYDVTSLNSFIVQASQYKPFYFKSGWLIFWIVVYLGALPTVIYGYLKIGLRQDEKKSS